MAQFIVKYFNDEIANVELNSDVEYIIGRDATCDIILTGNKKGISRQHLRLFFTEDAWHIEVLSRYGKVTVAGEHVDHFSLDEVKCFNIKDFKFEFVNKKAPQEVHDQDEAQKDLDSTTNSTQTTEDFFASRTENNQNIQVENQIVPLTNKSKQESKSFDDHTPTTQISSSNISAQISFTGKNGKERFYQIKENNSVIGRDASCDISITDKALSRRHFEINKTEDKFYIIDLGSANGTFLNDRPVSKNQAKQLESGDVISIANLEMKFEIVDVRFHNQLQFLPQSQSSLVGGNMPVPPIDAGMNVIKYDRGAQRKSFTKPLLTKLKNPKNKKIRLGVFAGVILLILFVLTSPSEKKSDHLSGKQDYSSTLKTFENLSPDQKSVIVDTLNLARVHFKSGKYNLCTSEIQKLHNIIPYYENSKEIATFCLQGADMLKVQQEKERQEAEKLRIENKIKFIAESCKEKINTYKTVDEMRQCLITAIELDPEHALITELLTLMEFKEKRQKDLQSQKAYRQRQMRIGEKKYKKAKILLEKGRLRKAINAYNNFLNFDHDDLKGYKKQATREIASARERLDKKIRFQFNQCKKLYQDRKFKDSIIACSYALKEDPANSDVQSFRRKVLSELRKEMKAIYEDSILEESLGNVDAAKEKWKRILNLDIPSDEYFIKSKSKLKKYGIGI